MMPEIEVTQEVTVYPDVQVWCNSCGRGLCDQTEVKHNELHVTPCQDCLDNASEDGHETGYQSGYEEGYQAGEEGRDGGM